jgi:hypothetical protein
MAYTADKPKLVPPSDELRARIKGWGADLNPADRPAVPKERFNLANGSHWTFPERQPETYRREKSTEHKFMTPVFGTSCPPRGISGVIRRWAYASFSEGQTMHWMLLVLADRIDVIESRLKALVTGKPDILIKEAGLTVELKRGVFRSRFGQHRADLKHLPVDFMMFGTTRLLALAGAVAVGLGIRSIVRAVT